MMVAFHSASASVMEATNFGMLFMRSANPSSSVIPGQAAAKCS
jgi:hypothetical protein